MKKKLLFVLTLLFLVLIPSSFGQGIVINEILSSNSTVNQDEDGTYQDWVELFNNSRFPINLSGYGLSDDSTLPYKWVFPNITLAPGYYMLVWCSDKNRTDSGSELHTNFKLSSGGDVVVLTNPLNVLIDSVPATTLLQNVSYGRLPNGSGPFVYFAQVTPAALNSDIGYNEILSPPIFSNSATFSTSEFDLTLTTSVPGATVLYTLDGSEPKQSNLGGTTYRYKNQYPENIGDATGPFFTESFKTLEFVTPISIVDCSSKPNKIAAIATTFSFDPTYIPINPVFKGTVVRAKVIKPGALESKTVSKTYFINPSGINRFSLPIVSLSIDEDQFFDYDKGIYVPGIDSDTWRINNPTTDPKWLEGIGNYYRTGRANEKVANMSYYVNGTEVINQEVGLRIRGGISRTFESKSLTIYARSDYGKGTLDYKFFGDLPYDSFTALVLRNSGGDFQNTMFRDALNQQICKYLHPEKESYQPTVTFINGEFWGILNIRDRYDIDYFKRVYNATAVDFLENDANIMEGDDLNYNALIDYLTTNSLVNPTNYEYIKTQLDPINLTDYYISNIFLENEDWPNNNIQYWRNKIVVNNLGAPNGLDGRWRWLYHDMDNSFSFVSGDMNSNTLEVATSVNTTDVNPEYSTLILRKLLENTTFKNDFINRFADLLNTTFLPSRTTSLLNSMKSVIYPTIPEHIDRWKSPSNKSSYDWSINHELSFLNQRPDFQRNHIRSVFNINSNINATLNVSGAEQGFIKMNSIEIKEGTDGILLTPYPWSGIYFSNIPISLKAIAYPGFSFSHWSGASSSTNPEITITMDKSYDITAVFVTETVASSQPIYFWMFDNIIANNLPLETLNTSYKAGINDGVINFSSCLLGYPFVSSDLNWRKASMERRNGPTEINYIPYLNNNITFATSNMRGLQIKEPFLNNGLENTMVFNFSTSKYKDIKFSFAAINELTNAENIIVEYALNSGLPFWMSTGLTSNSFPLTASYQLFNVDLSSVTSANDNPNFKVRLRFSGSNMTADTGARITFNNIVVHGTQLPLAVVQNEAQQFSVYPNPFLDFISINGINQANLVSYKLFTIDGKLIKYNSLENNKIDLTDLDKGIYLLQLSSNEKTEIKKIVKK